MSGKTKEEKAAKAEQKRLEKQRKKERKAGLVAVAGDKPAAASEEAQVEEIAKKVEKLRS